MRLMAERRQPFLLCLPVTLHPITVQRFLYSAAYCPHRKMLSLGKGFVYNVALVQKLCADIAAEKDPQKVQDLLSLLQAVIRENQEEIRDRMAFLAKNYAEAISETKAAD